MKAEKLIDNEESIANLSKYVGRKVNETELMEGLDIFRKIYSTLPVIYPGDSAFYDRVSKEVARGLTLADGIEYVIKELTIFKN